MLQFASFCKCTFTFEFSCVYTLQLHIVRFISLENLAVIRRRTVDAQISY